ncbi:MAG TPA: decaprenyl-phosphate phosphoribosyltransferase [SAR202 cluster bacterium]|nr:decaprenyl-phosphate phosphoribosyltransferase [SAR202 cluster bacterium]
MVLLRTMRPRQWTKNLLVFLALFFTINEAWTLDDLSAAFEFVGRSFGALAVFCALSGAVYIINDVTDAESDRAHPRKRTRPIASGDLAAKPALFVAVALIAAVLGGAFALDPMFGGVAVGYVATTVAYSFVLKNVILLDVFAVAAGFVLRVVAGAAVLDVPISPWLYLCTGLGALYIALSKRRSELASAGEAAANQRGILGRYSLGLLDQLSGVVATSAMISYSLYTFTAPNLPDNHTMMLTIPFVGYGLFRYMYLVHSHNLGENPEEIILTDFPMTASIVLWTATTAWVLMAFR